VEEFKRYTAPCEYKADSLDLDGTFSGYGSIFDEVDDDKDLIVAGTFARTLAAWKKQKRLPPVVWQHDFRNPVGPHLEMSEDDKGLRLKGLLLVDDIPKAREARALMKHKAVNGLSIGFITKKAKPGKAADGTPIRVIQEADLIEVSIVTLGSNRKAVVTDVKGSTIISVESVDALVTPKEFEELLREAGFSRQAATAFMAKSKRQGEPVKEKTMADVIAAIKSATNELKGTS
jgi:uncharacterized protein